MALTPAERTDLIDRYARGPARLREALSKVPEEARRWRPAAGRWSVQEIVCHCADAETNGASRIRYVMAEDRPVIVAYDQEAWASRLGYDRHPIGVALLVVEAVRAHTAALIRELPDEAWQREAAHSEFGRHTAEDWLKTYGEHLEKHAGQIERNLAAWEAWRERMPEAAWD